jgi:hypothetical protein
MDTRGGRFRRSRRRSRRFWIANEDVRCVWGGAHVTVSLWLTALVSGVLPGLVCLVCPYIANSSFALPPCCV